MYYFLIKCNYFFRRDFKASIAREAFLLISIAPLEAPENTWALKHAECVSNSSCPIENKIRFIQNKKLWKHSRQ